MINFRFHLVSLTAVFLALAAGIAIGAGVVDRQTVGFLEDRLQAVERNRDDTNAENDRLRSDNTLWERFSEEAGDRMVDGALAGVPVVVVGVTGTDRASTDALRDAMQAAGASLQGSIWLTNNWTLTDEDDTRDLASLLGASAQPTTGLRLHGIERLADAWTAGAGTDLLVALRDAGFVEYDAPPGTDLSLHAVSLADAAVVIASGSEADVATAELALPLVRFLRERGRPVLAVEPAPPTQGASAPGVASLVRGDDAIASQVATVDNVDDYRGRTAAVLALAELRTGRAGHYGTANGARRIVPEPPH